MRASSPPRQPSGRCRAGPPYHRRVSSIPRDPVAARRTGAPADRGVDVRACPRSTAVAPMDAAEAFRDLPGLALLESARPGRTGRWSYLTADPVAVARRAGRGPGPVRGGPRPARRLAGTARAGRPTRPTRPAVRGRARGVPGLRPRRGGSSGCRASPGWTSTCPCSGSRSTTGRSRGTGGRGAGLARRARPRRGWPRGPRGGSRSRAGSRAYLAGYLPDPVPVPGPAVRRRGPGPDARSGPAPRAATGSTRVEAVRAAIGRGEIYQANLTRRLEAPFRGDPWPLFRRLRTGDPALFAGYLDLGRLAGDGGARGPCCRPRRSRSSRSTRTASSARTRSRAPGRGAGRGTRTGRWPASCSPAPRTRPRT